MHLIHMIRPNNSEQQFRKKRKKYSDFTGGFCHSFGWVTGSEGADVYIEFACNDRSSLTRIFSIMSELSESNYSKS